MLIITFNILYIMIDLQSYVLSQTIQITNDSTICMYQNQRLAVVYHPQFIAAYHHAQKREYISLFASISSSRRHIHARAW